MDDIEADFHKTVHDHDVKAILKTRAVIAAIVSVGIILSGIMVWGILEIRNTQLNGTPTGKAILESAETIEDCTKTTGKCYARNQANLAGAIDSINDYTIFAIACGVNLVQGDLKPTPAEVRRCVTESIEDTP